MLKLINHFSTALRNYVSPGETELEIPFNVAKKLNTLSEGDHTYLSLVGRNGRSEIVKYTHTAPLKNGVVTVERDVGQTGSINHPAGTCVTIDVNTVLLDEYVGALIESRVAQEVAKHIEAVTADVAAFKKDVEARLKKAGK